MEENEIYPICQHIKDKSLYLYKGNDVFESLATGVSKAVKPEVAATIFVFNLELTETIKEYPDVLGLLKLGFKQR